jgi:hypothetical protein
VILHFAYLLTGGGRQGQPLAPKSVRYAHAILRQALSEVVRDGLLEHNVAERVTLPRLVPDVAPDVAAGLRVWDADQAAVPAAQRRPSAPRPVPCCGSRKRIRRSCSRVVAGAQRHVAVGWVDAVHRSDGAGVEVCFTGETVRLIDTMQRARGTAKLSIDCVSSGTIGPTIDTYAAATSHQVVIFQATDLGLGEHTMRMVNNGAKNPSASVARIG